MRFPKSAKMLMIAVLAAVATAIFPAPSNAETAVADAAAIEAIPERGDKNVAFEGAAYYDRVTENGVFVGGASVGLDVIPNRGFSLGAAWVHDNTGDNTSVVAVGGSFDLSDNAKVKFGLVPDFEADGFDKVGTVGGGLRFEFGGD